MLTQDYGNISVLSIAANGRDMSFSSDTGMAECLVIARKLTKGEPLRQSRYLHLPPAQAQRIWLFKFPSGQARWMATIARRLEDGPYGGITLMVGEELAGETITAPLSPEGGHWSTVRVSDYSLAQTAYALSQSQAMASQQWRFCRVRDSFSRQIGNSTRTYHLDIIGRAPRGPLRMTGHFDEFLSPTATYPNRPVEPQR